MSFLYALVILLLGVVAAGFLDQNRELATLVYFSRATPPMPVGVLVLLAFAAGYFLALALGLLGALSGKVRLRRAEREARRLAGELARRETSRDQ